MKDVDEVITNMMAVENDFSTLKIQGAIVRQIVEENYTWPQICDQYLELVKEF